MTGRRFAALAAGFAAMISVGVIAAISVGDGLEPGAPQVSPACLSGRLSECLGDELAVIAERDPKAALEEYENRAAADPLVKAACHDVFHRIGRAAIKSDSSAWQVFLAGNSECNWGYIHGAVEGYLAQGGGDPASRAGDLCTPDAGLDTTDPYIMSVAGNCVHGTGHALFESSSDPVEAEQGCRTAFSDLSSALSCIDGMIMEFGNSDAAKAGQHGDICRNIGQDAKATCYSNIALTWFNQSGGDYLKVLNQCDEGGSTELITKCAWGAGNLFTVQNGFDLPWVQQLCAQLDAVKHEACYRGAAVSVALGVNTGVLGEADLETFITTAPVVGWVPGIRADVQNAAGGFGERAA